MRVNLCLLCSVCVLLLPTLVWSQTKTPPAQVANAQPSSPPPTKLEGFQPAAGSVVTFGYDNLRSGVYGVSVDVREVKDSKGNDVKGLLVEIKQNEYRTERSFVDADEIPELLNGFDALMKVSSNPTPFKNFEVRYTTRGNLRLTAFNSSNGKISYSVETGEYSKAQLFLSEKEMSSLREAFVEAQQKILSLKQP